MTGYFHRVSARTPTDFWINNVTLREADLAIQAGCSGCTQNPAFVWRILNGSEDKGIADGILDTLMAGETDDKLVLPELQAKLIQEICHKFLPVFQAHKGNGGWVSIQGDPFHEDHDTIARYGRYCRTLAPNIIVKIPATESGLSAVETLLMEGVPVLVTEVMSVDQALAVCSTVERCADKTACVPTVYMAQIAGIFDEHLQDTAQKQGLDVDPELFFTAGVAVAKKIRRMMTDRRSSVRFMSGGARAQHHFTELVGVDGCVTINWIGHADTLMEQNPPVIQRFHTPPEPALLDELSTVFSDFRLAYTPGSLTPGEFESFGPVGRFRAAFERGWHNALEYIARRRAGKD